VVGSPRPLPAASSSVAQALTGRGAAGGFAGTIALTATLAAIATVTELLGASHPPNVAYSLLDWTLIGLELDVGITLVLL
jgi:hypothetical protein